MPKDLSNAPANWIPNIHLGEDYDQRYRDAPIHYDAHENLAGYFGREMPVHRHAQNLQIHYIDRGKIDFHIDDKVYSVTGPVCFLTPASVPHSFRSDRESRGHVLTIHQSLVWQLLKDGLAREINSDLSEAVCIEKAALAPQQQALWTQLEQTFTNIQNEWHDDLPGKSLAIDSLVRLLLIRIARISSRSADSSTVASEDLRLFHQFSEMIEEHYRAQWHLPQYTAAMNISESRLNQICQRISARSPKKLIHDRLIQESKRLLIFTNLSASEISYQLGFTDPAYFSRFFKNHTDRTTQQYRREHK